MRRRQAIAQQYALNDGWARRVWDDWTQQSLREQREMILRLQSVSARGTWARAEFDREFAFLIKRANPSRQRLDESPRTRASWFPRLRLSESRVMAGLMACSLLVPGLAFVDLIHHNPQLWWLGLVCGALLVAALSVQPLIMHHAHETAFWSRLAVCLARTQSAAGNPHDPDQASALLFRDFCLHHLALKEREQLEAAVNPAHFLSGWIRLLAWMARRIFHRGVFQHRKRDPAAPLQTSLPVQEPSVVAGTDDHPMTPAQPVDLQSIAGVQTHARIHARRARRL